MSVAFLALGAADSFFNLFAVTSIELRRGTGLPLTFVLFIQHEAFVALKALLVIVPLAFSGIECGTIFI